jgi:hypothetical protein
VTTDGLLILQLCCSRLVIGSVTLAVIDSAGSPQTLCKFTQAVALVTCTPKMYSSNLARNIDYPDNNFIGFPRFLLPRVMTGKFLELGYTRFLPHSIEFTVEPVLD